MSEYYLPVMKFCTKSVLYSFYEKLTIMENLLFHHILDILTHFRHSIFKSFHCFLLLMNRYRLQFRVLTGRPSVPFSNWGMQSSSENLGQRSIEGGYPLEPFFSPTIAAQLLCALAHCCEGEWKSDSSTSLASHMQFASANNLKPLSKIL